MNTTQFHELLATIYIVAALFLPANRKVSRGFLIGCFIFHILHSLHS